MHLSRFPRTHLAHLPTPLEPMERLSKALGGPNLFIKRDDCTGLATGGNKTRKLEFLMADALEQGADCVITPGAVQSNHVRQTAAAATKLGLGCHILLERRVPGTSDLYDRSANVFLDRLFGAEIVYHPAGYNVAAELEATSERLRQEGKRPYIVPGGGSNPIGALGYVDCALEILIQANARGLRIDHLVMATGSTGTQAGLVVGFEGSNSGIPVLGISTKNNKEKQEANVYRLVQSTADLLGIEVSQNAVVADGDWVGGGYGIPTPEMVEAVRLVARTEAILLDPVYTGKGMAGLIGLIRQGRFGADENIVFLHTGGSVGLFATEEQFDAP